MVAGSGCSSILLRLGEEVDATTNASASSSSLSRPVLLTSRTPFDCVLRTLGRRKTSKDDFEELLLPSTASSPSSQFHVFDASSSRLCLPLSPFFPPHMLKALTHFPFVLATEAPATRLCPFDDEPSASAL